MQPSGPTGPSPPPPSCTRIIIQTPLGLEHVAAREIQAAFSSHLQSITPIPLTNGITILELSAPPSPALALSLSRLACVDAAAVFCGVYQGLTMDSSAIDVLMNAANEIEWNAVWQSKFVPMVQQQQQQQQHPTFRCTCARTVQMADWGYNKYAPTGSAHLQGGPIVSIPDPAVIFARCSDAATSQSASHVSASSQRHHCNLHFPRGSFFVRACIHVAAS